MSSKRVWAVAGGMTLIAVLATAPRSFGADKTVKDGVFTAAQATRGAALYKTQCASCHGVDLSGGKDAPALTGADFLGFWDKTPVSDLVTKIRDSMPQSAPGSLSAEQATDLVTYVLRSNKFPAGAAALPSNAAAQKTIKIVK